LRWIGILDDFESVGSSVGDVCRGRNCDGCRSSVGNGLSEDNARVRGDLVGVLLELDRYSASLRVCPGQLDSVTSCDLVGALSPWNVEGIWRCSILSNCICSAERENDGSEGTHVDFDLRSGSKCPRESDTRETEGRRTILVLLAAEDEARKIEFECFYSEECLEGKPRIGEEIGGTQDNATARE